MSDARLPRGACASRRLARLLAVADEHAAQAVELLRRREER